ncbi:hypothetical protein [Micromonospora echinospora]
MTLAVRCPPAGSTGNIRKERTSMRPNNGNGSTGDRAYGHLSAG